MNRRKGKIAIIAVILIVLGGIGVYGYSIYKGFMKDYKGDVVYKGEDITIEIPAGASTSSIAALLKENKIITYEKAFELRVKNSKYNGQLKYGIYTITDGMTLDEIIELMSVGDQRESTQFTIPEGYSIEMMASKLESENICSASDFLEAVQATDYDFDFISTIPDDSNIKYKLQGFLFPDTYSIFEDATAHDIVNMMLSRFDSIYTDEMKAKAEEMGYSTFEIVTIGSIIEREAKLDEERPTISGVIYNRLNINMKLQMCPTVLYAITDGMYDVNQVLYADLEVDSPYNTYMYEGLPVGPICSPGQSTLEAACNPEEHNYYFYHTDDETKGNHIFSETYEEHQDTRVK